MRCVAAADPLEAPTLSALAAARYTPPRTVLGGELAVP
jgi:hypothetical protein